MADEKLSPPLRDSDLMYLCIRQLERVAERMARYDYGPELRQDMQRAVEWFEWAAYNYAKHSDGAASPEGVE